MPTMLERSSLSEPGSYMRGSGPFLRRDVAVSKAVKSDVSSDAVL